MVPTGTDNEEQTQGECGPLKHEFSIKGSCHISTFFFLCMELKEHHVILIRYGFYKKHSFSKQLTFTSDQNAIPKIKWQRTDAER